ncbi:MAG TPA: DUF6178 family protein [Polyangia bacterium]|nr:DUF6178 family protein [Polyangia bacterium]
MPDEPKDAVIPLSRWRAALARARRGRRADALLAEPNAEALIPKLPVQELYYAIQEVGLADAHELVALASAEQLRGFVDLDAWQRDHLDETRLKAWLDVLVDAGPLKLAMAVEALDAEVLALYLQRQARVYDLNLDEVPEEAEGHYYPTPDRFFLLDILVEGEQGKSLERLIDWLYRADLELARRVVMSAKWELASDLEEWSLRWRSGRMSDLGYVDYYEALGIYRYLDPATVKVGEATNPPLSAEPIGQALPAQLASALDESSFFARALGTLASDDEIERLQSLLLLLVNKAMAADLVSPGDVERAQSTLIRAVGYLNIGLEYLGRGVAAEAGNALRTVALERIFRVGVSLTLQLKRLAETLLEKGQVQAAIGDPPVALLLLDAPYDALVAALAQARPLLALDDRPPRAFQTLADIARAAAMLEEASRVGPLVFGGLGLDLAALAEALHASASPPGEVRFGTLVRTACAQVLAGRGLKFAPLAPADLKVVRARLAGGQLTADARADVERAIAGRLTERNVEYPPALSRWLDGWLAEFASALDRPDGLLIKLV